MNERLPIKKPLETQPVQGSVEISGRTVWELMRAARFWSHMGEQMISEAQLADLTDIARDNPIGALQGLINLTNLFVEKDSPTQGQ